MITNLRDAKARLSLLVHLAAARVAQLRSIVTTDRRMRVAAEAIGMTAVDP
ncbi:MAG: hypothetical protein O3A37_04985 [Planctomycetota bacterium]|nr:hypothetical protein [Planctomycetota bacterium]